MPAWLANTRGCINVSPHSATPASRKSTGGRSSSSRMPFSSANAASSRHTRSDMNTPLHWALLALQLCASARQHSATRIDLNRGWVFTHRNGNRSHCRFVHRLAAARFRGVLALRRSPSHLESRRRRLRLSRHRLVFPQVRSAQTTRGRDRAAPLRRHFLQGARVAQRRRDRRARGRLHRVFLRCHVASARRAICCRRHRQSSRHVHHPRLRRARRSGCLVRLVGVRRHRARRVAGALRARHRAPRISPTAAASC